MAPQKHSEGSANTTQVFSPEHRDICTALRCEADTGAFLAKGKHPSPPSHWHKEAVSDEDADKSPGRDFQNDCATRPCAAERAVRSACRPLTPAAGAFAAAKTSQNRPMATAAAKARPDTPGVPGPGPSRCAKANPRPYTGGAPGPGSSLPSTCPILSLRSRQACAHGRNPTSRNGGRYHFVPLYSIARAHAVAVVPRTRLEGALAPFPRYLSARSRSCHIRARKSQLQPDQQADGIARAHPDARLLPTVAETGSYRRAAMPRAPGEARHVDTGNRLCVGTGRDRGQRAGYPSTIAHAGRCQREWDFAIVSLSTLEPSARSKLVARGRILPFLIIPDITTAICGRHPGGGSGRPSFQSGGQIARRADAAHGAWAGHRDLA